MATLGFVCGLRHLGALLEESAEGVREKEYCGEALGNKGHVKLRGVVAG